MSSQLFYRNSWCNIQLDAIRHNIRELKKVLPTETKIFAVVKGNAYGHGDVQVARTAIDEGVYGLAVTLLDEALRIRREGIKQPILVMSWIRPEDVTIAAEHDITITVFQPEWVKEAARFLNQKNLKVHIKVDSGMGRVGVRTEDELISLIEELKMSPFSVTGIFTHLATADEAEHDYYKKQQSRFSALLNCCQKLIKEPLIVHTGNSAASMRFPDDMQDGVRFGISMYGLYPSPHVRNEQPMPLKPAFSLHSKLIHVKKTPSGEGISYGKTYITGDDEWIGTVPIGYADGWVRKLNTQHVLIQGKKMPIIGRICMDQFMVKLDKQYAVGEEVTLIGKQKDEEVSVDEIAEQLETITYEIPCMISYRVPRVYVDNGEIVHVENKVY